jgi:hypothetical protein
MDKLGLLDLYEKQLKHMDSKKLRKRVLDARKKLEKARQKLEAAKGDVALYRDLELDVQDLEREVNELSSTATTEGYLLRNSDLVEELQQKKQLCSTSVHGEVTTTSGSARVDQYNSLRSTIDPSFYATDTVLVTRESYCFKCQKFRACMTDSGTMVCPGCKDQESMSSIYTKTAIGDLAGALDSSVNHDYQRYTHFCNCLSNIQGIGNANIPQEVYDTIELEIKRERMQTRMDELTSDDIQRYLRKYRKKRNYDKYYEHKTLILYKVTKRDPPRFTEEQKHNLKMLFLVIQEPFEKFKTPGRTNFSSYTSIIHKFCQLLGYREFLAHLRPPKHPQVRKEHELMWEKICRYMGGEKQGWKFMRFEE